MPEVFSQSAHLTELISTIAHGYGEEAETDIQSLAESLFTEELGESWKDVSPYVRSLYREKALGILKGRYIRLAPNNIH